jgi:hypothetical protein
MMRVNFRLMMVFVSIAIVVTRFVTGCKPAEPAPTAAPAPVPVTAAASEQQPGASAPQAPAVPDAAEPAGSQVQFK